MGYSKGRVVSAATRKPASAVFEESETPSSAKKSGSTPKTLDELFNLQDLDLGDDEGFGFDSGMGKDPLGVTEEDDGLEDFQLDAVEILRSSLRENLGRKHMKFKHTLGIEGVQ